jgi:hypothetical protein
MRSILHSVVVLVLLFGLVCQVGVIAQTSGPTTVPYTDPNDPFMTGTQTTQSTSITNGDTVVTVTDVTTGSAGGPFVSRTYTSVTEKDAAGNTVKVSRKESTTKFDKDPKKGGKQVSQDTWSEVDTYDETGGYDRVSDETTVDNKTGETTDEHVEMRYNPSSRPTKGHRTTTTRKPGQKPVKTEEEFDPGKNAWAPVTLAPFGLQPQTAANGDGARDEVAYLPDVAGPGSTILATFEDPEQAGPGAQAIVAFEDPSGHRSFFKAIANAQHKIAFQVAEGAVAVFLFKHFAADGKPDDAAVKCDIGRDTAVRGTDEIGGAPAQGPAILRAATTYERGGESHGLLSLQTRDTDPLTAHAVVDGNALGADTVAASDRSVKALFDNAEPLGRHAIAVRSGNGTSNAVAADLVTLRTEAGGVGETGTVKTLHVHVDGLPKGDKAVLFAHVGGSARMADGSDTGSVPVDDDGIADVRIRAEHAGAALVSFVVRAELAGLATQAREGLPPTTERSPAPSPTPTSIEPADLPSAPPVIYGHDETLVPCRVWIDDGWFEPSQGVWQDDTFFQDHPGKQITRTDNGGNPTYTAELAMVLERDTMLFGVVHYEKNNAERTAGSRYRIHTSGYTTCNGPPEPVKMRFTVFSGSTGEVIYTSREVAKISFTGGAVKREAKPAPWTADLPDYVPKPGTPYRFTAKGAYRIEDELLRDSGPTGMKVIVSGNAVATQKLRIGFAPVYFRPFAAAADEEPVDDLDAADLLQNTLRLARASASLIPDYYPLSTGGWESRVFSPPDDLTSLAARNPDLESADRNRRFGAQLRVQSVLDHKYSVVAKEAMPEPFNRIVVTPSDAGFTFGIADAAGISFAQTVVAVPAQGNYLTVAHEIAHTLPYLWSSDQMIRDCSRPGDYHNTLEPYADGVRIDVAGKPGYPVGRSGPPFMGKAGDTESQWIDQCTFWHLTNALQAVADPQAIFVHGELVAGGAPQLWPGYTIDGGLSVPQAGGPNQWTIRLEGPAGTILASYRFTPQWFDENGRPLPRTTFQFTLPEPAGLGAIELLGPHGERSTLHAAGANVGVHVTQSVVHGTSVALAWRISGAVPPAVVSSVLVDGPDGETMAAPVFETNATAATIALSPPVKGVPLRYRLRVIVTDNIHTATDAATVTVSGP